MQTGFYFIKHEGQVLPARFDGEKWHHEKGTHFHDDDESVIGPIAFSCPTGCTCKTNPDGSITVNC